MKNIPNIKGHRTPPRQRGAAAVEFAFFAVLLLMIVGAVIEFGRTFWYYDALSKATRDGARVLSLADPDEINSVGVPAVQNLVVDAANAARVSPELTTTNVVVECLDASYAAVSCVDGTAPANVRVSIVDFSVSIGGWMPLFISTGGAVTFEPALAPFTTMRYMN